MKLSTVLTMLSLAVIIALGGRYVHEENSDVLDYIEFYGHVTQSKHFESPQLIRNYTFGRYVQSDTMKTTYENQLWCAPLGSGLRPHMLYNRITTFDEAKLNNDYSELTVEPITNVQWTTTITNAEADKIREVEGLSGWTIGEYKMQWDAECHLNTYVTVYTTVFNKEKVTHYRGPNFNYLVGVEYNGNSFDDQDLDNGSLITAEEEALNSGGIKVRHENIGDVKKDQYED